MEQYYAARSLRRLAVCAACFILEEWRLAIARAEAELSAPSRQA